MGYFWPLATLWIVHLMAAMSPGQSFLVVSRTALVSGRPAGVASALGMGIGVLPWAVGAMLGLAVLFAQAPWLYAALRIAGGLYLIYVAVMVWRHAADPVAMADDGERVSTGTALRQACLTQIANPKVAVFFGSIFVAVLPPSPPLWLAAAILAIVFFNELAWYAAVAVLFSAERPRRAYLSAKAIIDRVMAGLLGLLGAKLIDGAVRE
jgi:threonine/homoserine/homoserine lactone efflux protein